MIQNILDVTSVEPSLTKLKNAVLNYNQMVDVTHLPIVAGDKVIKVNGHSYDAKQFTTVNDGTVVRLFQHNGILLAVHNKKQGEISAVMPVTDVENTQETHGLFFTPASVAVEQMPQTIRRYLRGEHYLIEKVVGTSYRDVGVAEEYAGKVTTEGDVAILNGQAILMPEPHNEHDPHAIAVVARLKDGKPRHIGYLAKESDLYHSIKKTTACTLFIKEYSKNQADWSDSYVVRVETNKL